MTVHTKCKYCGKDFTAVLKRAAFCSDICRNRYHAKERKVALEAYRKAQNDKA